MRGGDRTVARQATANGLASERSFDALATVRWWTADLALELLPETNQPRIEVLHGSVIVSPHAGWQHQRIERELTYLMNRACRGSELEVVGEVNVKATNNLFIPDIVAAVRPEGSPREILVAQVALVGEITSPSNRFKDVIDRPREYADAGVPRYLLVDLHNDSITLILYRLVDGAYVEESRAVPGETFRMTEPFAFEVDPAELLDS